MFTVLIADDEAIIRKGLRQIINWEDLGFTIIGEAANGGSALNFIENNNPDVVMIDIRMPNLHGLEAIAKARDAGYTGKFIILSGYSEFSYAQEAIRQGVTSYLTKPVDEKELEKILIQIHDELEKELSHNSRQQVYMTKAKEAVIRDFLTHKSQLTENNIYDLHLTDDIYQVVLYEKYSYDTSDISYNFSELLQITNNNNDDFDFINIKGNNVIILKGSHAVEKFENVLNKFSGELPPEKNSPLDTVFITCGRKVSSAYDIVQSYDDAYELLTKRFFCDQYQHIVTFDDKDKLHVPNTSLNAQDLMDTYTNALINHIQAYNRNKIANTLKELQNDLYHTDMTTDEEKNFLIDLYLHIKEKIYFLYKASDIPFIANSEAINFIIQSYYLYEIIAFLSNQFEMVMSSIGYSSKDSIIDDVVHYIDHNYSENITLENIAPLFGYNSSYLGKIFSKKMGINFNAYLDNIRIEHSKELLLGDKTQVYKIAELVGYRNVDYFHIKFKKSTGITPAEYRRQNQR
jgi:two-component system response regulator YesN